MTDNSTIFAPITANLNSATIIFRISGPKALTILELFAVKLQPKPRYAHLVELRYQGQLIDQALLTFFKAPQSYTGEDVIELAIHGSSSIYKKIIKILAEHSDFNYAQPGEFTKRAVHNNKLDLLQAEAINDLIKAETDKQANLALKQLSGEFSDFYKKLRDDLVKSRALLEAYLDFPEEVIPDNDFAELKNLLDNMLISLRKKLEDNKAGELLQQGLQLAIFGPPNSGKSSLINYLAGKDIAIVSEYAGTTRDIISVKLDIAGYPVIISDTAGIRSTEDQVEKIGIEKAEQLVKTADLKILLLAIDNLESAADYQDFLDQDSLLVINKNDLAQNEQPQIKYDLAISLKAEQQLDNLLKLLEQKIIEKYQITEDIILTSGRQRAVIEQVVDVLNVINLNNELEIVAEQLRNISNLLGQLLGIVDIEEVLDKIFREFCIGK